MAQLAARHWTGEASCASLHRHVWPNVVKPCTTSHSKLANHGGLGRSHVCHALDEEKAEERSQQAPKQQLTQLSSQQQQQQQQHSSVQDQPEWLQWAQQRWQQLNGAQRGYTVLVGVLALAALPRLIMLLVLLVERLVVGGLLAFEELLVDVLLKGSAVLGLAGVVALLVVGVNLFTRKATR